MGLKNRLRIPLIDHYSGLSDHALHLSIAAQNCFEELELQSGSCDEVLSITVLITTSELTVVPCRT